MVNNLVPTPIVDKNGKRTTVHRKPAAASGTRLASVPPVPPAEAGTGTPLPVVYPLSRGEVEEFLAWFNPSTSDAGLVFNSLSGPTKGLVWRARQLDVANDSTLGAMLEDYHVKSQSHWYGTDNPERAAEEHLRSCLRVAERVHSEYPQLWERFSEREVHWDIERALEGYFYRLDDDGSPVHEITTVEELDSVVAVVAYIISCHDTPAHLGMAIYTDTDGRRRTGKVIKNRTLDAYVRQHPELGLRIGELVAERGIGDTEDDAQHVLDLLRETAEAPSIQSGWL